MINLLGEKGFEGKAIYQGLEKALEMDGIYPHIYGKEFTKPFRKMGHITVTGSKLSEVKSLVKQVKSKVKVRSVKKT